MDRISMMAAEAREMGLSYGKYAALVREGLVKPGWTEEPEEAEAETKPDVFTEMRHCVVCGRELKPGTRRGTLTCGSACSYERARQVAREAYRMKHGIPEYEVRCASCGKTFIARNRGRRFCTDACRYRASQANHRKRLGKGGNKMAERAYGIGVCRICGAEFVKRSPGHRVCGPECQKIARRRQKKC